MIENRIAAAFVSGLVGALSACGGSQLVCVQDTAVPIRVEVRDPSTGANLADVARGVAIGAEATDSLKHSLGPEPPFLFGGMGGGPFTVQVEVPGYQPWFKSGIVVGFSAGPCSQLQTVTVTALLEPGLP